MDKHEIDEGQVKQRRSVFKITTSVLAALAAAFAFVFTVLLPVTKKYFWPITRPADLVRVGSSLITDMDGLYTLHMATRNNPVVLLNNLPLTLRITNMGEQPLLLEELILHASVDRKLSRLIGTRAEKWDGEYIYTGSANADYDLFNMKIPDKATFSMSVFTEYEPFSNPVSSYKRLYYRIPPGDSDLIGIGIGRPFESKEDPGLLAVFRIEFEIRGSIGGNALNFRYQPPYAFARAGYACMRNFFPDYCCKAS